MKKLDADMLSHDIYCDIVEMISEPSSWATTDEVLQDLERKKVDIERTIYRVKKEVERNLKAEAEAKVKADEKPPKTHKRIDLTYELTEIDLPPTLARKFNPEGFIGFTPTKSLHEII